MRRIFGSTDGDERCKVTIPGGGTNEYKLYNFTNNGTIERTNVAASAILVDDTLKAGTALHVGSITRTSQCRAQLRLVALEFGCGCVRRSCGCR